MSKSHFTPEFPEPVQNTTILSKQYVAGLVKNPRSRNNQKVFIQDQKTNKVQLLDQAGVNAILSLNENEFVTVSLRMNVSDVKDDRPSAKQALALLDEVGERNFFDDTQRILPSITFESEAQVWDVKTMKVIKRVPLFDKESDIFNIDKLALSSDGKLIAGIVSYWGIEQAINKDKDDELGYGLLRSVFVLDKNACVVKVETDTRLLQATHLTFLSGNRLAAVTLLDGIHLYDVSLESCAIHYSHLKAFSERLNCSNLLGLLESPNKEYWITYHSTNQICVWKVGLNGDAFEKVKEVDNVNVDPSVAPSISSNGIVTYCDLNKNLKQFDVNKISIEDSYVNVPHSSSSRVGKYTAAMFAPKVEESPVVKLYDHAGIKFMDGYATGTLFPPTNQKPKDSMLLKQDDTVIQKPGIPDIVEDYYPANSK